MSVSTNQAQPPPADPSAPTLDPAATCDPGAASGGSAFIPSAGRAFGDFVLIEEIARGGMGVVFRAMQYRPHRIVALKMILAGNLATPEQVRRFRVEAEEAGQLDHPNIVPIYHVGEHDGQHFFTMKLVDGGSLVGKVAELLPAPRSAAAVVAAIARAVHHAHQRGILHRDLKPANVLLQTVPAGATPDGVRGSCDLPSGHFVPMVTDFGLAKNLGGDSDTKTGAIMGTPAYMSPEQAGGRKDLTTASDVYSLGAVLYELVTGRPPFRAETPLDTLFLVVDTEPALPRTFNGKLDRDLETIVMRCLEKDPGRRYRTAEALADDLDRYRRGETIRARPAGRVERTLKWVRRRPAAASLVAVSVLAAIALAVGGWWHVVELRAALAAAEAAREDAQRNLVEAEAARTAAQNSAARLEASSRERLDDLDTLLMRFGKRLENIRGAEPVHRELLQDVIQMSTGVLNDRPDDVATKRKLGRLYQDLGLLEHEAENFAEGDDAYRKALDTQRPLAESPAAEASDREDLAYTLYLRGVLFRDSRKPAEAEPLLRESARRFDALLADHPEEHRPRSRAARTRYRLADVLEQRNRTDEAVALYRQALAEQRALAPNHPDETDYRQYAAATATALAALRETSDPDEALRTLQQVVRDEAAVTGARTGMTGPPLFYAYANLGAFLNRRHRHADLANLAEDIVRTTPDDYNQVYNAACYAANALSAVQADRSLTETDRTNVAETYGRRTVELLRRAIQCGYGDREHMADDTDLDPIRRRPDFLAFSAELERRNPTRPLTPARAVAGLKRQYQKEVADYQARRQRAQTAAEERLVDRSKPAPADFAPRFLRFAADHRNDPAAGEALAWVLENVEGTGRGLEVRREALDALEREHMDQPNLAALCERLAQNPSPECDKLLRAIMAKHANLDVRGAATLALAGSISQQAQTSYSGDHAGSAALFAEAEKLYETILKEYAAVVHGKSTLGDIVPDKLYELRHLSVGRTADEISGNDLDGTLMKLSDFRGKVVVLDFWANWCGYCRKMYPHEKAMVKRLAGEQFALVGVNCDEDLESTRGEIRRQAINWRSWSDRSAGAAVRVNGKQLSDLWQVDGFPRIFVLDASGVIRHRFDGMVSGTVLDAAVAGLLAETKAPQGR